MQKTITCPSRLRVTALILWTVLGITPSAHADLISSGDVCLTGTDACFAPPDVVIGQAAVGTFTINGGSTQTNGSARIGDELGSDGTATVTGAGSTWNNGVDLFVGSFGTGRLNVEAGGVVNNVDGRVGDQTTGNGDVFVTGSASQWNNSNDLFIGSFGVGGLQISAGGFVSNVNARLGDQTGGQGNATVSGNGSHWSSSQELFVGVNGTGTLTIENGATVSNTNGKIADEAGSEGSVTVTGTSSLWQNTADLFVSQGGEADLLIQQGASVEVANTATVGALGELSLNDGSLSATDLHLNGILNLVLDGVSTNALNITNSIFLGGTLSVSLADGYVPVLGDEFDFLFASDILGSFDTILLPSLVDAQFTFFNDTLNGVGGLQVSAVPVPGAAWLFASALAWLGYRRRVITSP